MHSLSLASRKIHSTDNLVAAIDASLRAKKETLKEGDILAIVSKVVALTEGGLVELSMKKNAISKHKRYGIYEPNPSLDELIKKESDVLFPGDMFLTIKDGIFSPGAGIDTSNTPEGYALGWPKDSYSSARKLRAQLQKKYRCKKLGVLIFDSYILPLRNGVTGIALGYAGFRGIESYRGKRDLFGKPLRVTQKNVADGLAAAATLLTGEGNESIPFVIFRDAGVKYTNAKISPQEIRRAPKDCLYEPLYPKALKRSRDASL